MLPCTAETTGERAMLEQLVYHSFIPDSMVTRKLQWSAELRLHMADSRDSVEKDRDNLGVLTRHCGE